MLRNAVKKRLTIKASQLSKFLFVICFTCYWMKNVFFLNITYSKKDPHENFNRVFFSKLKIFTKMAFSKMKNSTQYIFKEYIDINKKYQISIYFLFIYFILLIFFIIYLYQISNKKYQYIF